MSKIFAPNYTQIPNVILDYWIEHLNASEFKILIFLCRNTLGWHKHKTSISLNDIVKSLSLSKPTVIKALKELERLELVIINKRVLNDYNSINEYEINIIDEPQHEKEEQNDQGGKENLLGGSQKNLPGEGSKPGGGDSEKKLPLRLNKGITTNKRNTLQDDEASRVSLFFFSLLKKNNEHQKEPNFKKWANEIELMLRVDKRPVKETEEVIRFATSDDFWQGRIQSPSSLRNNWDRLYSQMKGKEKSKYKNDRTLRDESGNPINPELLTRF